MQSSATKSGAAKACFVQSKSIWHYLACALTSSAPASQRVWLYALRSQLSPSKCLHDPLLRHSPRKVSNDWRLEAIVISHRERSLHELQQTVTDSLDDTFATRPWLPRPIRLRSCSRADRNVANAASFRAAAGPGEKTRFATETGKYLIDLLQGVAALNCSQLGSSAAALRYI